MSIRSSGLHRPALGGVARSFAVVMAVAIFTLLAGCGLTNYNDTPVPTPAAPSTAPLPTGSATSPTECKNPTASYAASDKVGPAVQRIKDRGRLIVGVSADTLLLSSRNPFNGKIEGFDIDMVKAVTKSIFGNENAYELKVITSAQRIPALQNRDVDMVARNMTINCDRWTQVAFSTEYYHGGQKILVPRGSKATTLADLAGKRICAPSGSTSIANVIRLQPNATPVTADTETGCLVLFQSGTVDAISTDGTLLAGLAAQDPYAVVPKQKAFTDEPYGLAFNSQDVDLVRFANHTLAQVRSDGEWTKIYNRWLAPALGPAPEPPKAVYGR